MSLEKKLKICPNGFHRNGDSKCHCGEKFSPSEDKPINQCDMCGGTKKIVKLSGNRVDIYDPEEVPCPACTKDRFVAEDKCGFRKYPLIHADNCRKVGGNKLCPRYEGNSNPAHYAGCYADIPVSSPISESWEIGEILAEKWKDGEYNEALAYANDFLDEPYADPDDRIRTLARQFIRSTERMDRAVITLSSTRTETVQSAIEMIEEKTKDTKQQKNYQGCVTCSGSEMDCDCGRYNEALSDVVASLEELLNK